MIRSIVLDIEGTVSSLSYVRDHLFPYSRAHLAGWLAAHAHDEDVSGLLAEAGQLAGQPDAGRDELVEILRQWIDDDVKAPPLKSLQGMMWAEAFAAGDLTSDVYEDVPPALRLWTGQGRQVYVFSSGSVTAQRVWFHYCSQGNLLPYISGHFDTRNAGPKQDPRSYTVIAEAIGSPPGDILFLSDARAELDAARTAGWHVVGVRRDGAPSIGGSHREITTFATLDLPCFDDTPGTRARHTGH